MTRNQGFCASLIAMACLAGVATSLMAQAPQRPRIGTRPGREQLQQPVLRLAQQLPDANAVANNPVPAQPGVGQGTQTEHPLVPALQIAFGAMNSIRANVKDYSCTMFKRERINGKLNDQEAMYLQIRHEPFSVYMYFLGPERLKGQEALYVEGKNNGNLLGHGVGIRKIAGTVPLQPTGAMAMQGQRYPITEIGMLNLTKRLIEVAEKDKQFGECEVKFYKNAKINKRSVTCIEVIHPVPRKNFLFNKALVFVDDELNMPVRYESYDWPSVAGGQPELLEEYTYTNIKINNNYTDFDFDEHNPKYHFH